MLVFWLIIIGLTLLAIVLVVLPLLKTSSMTEEDRNNLNVAIYKERVAELEQENLTPEQLVLAKRELEKNLAQDLEITTATVGFSRAKWASFIVVLLVPFIALGGYWYIGSWHLLAEQPNIQAEKPAQTDMTEMVEKLSKRLKEQPDDIKGWRMLARSYTFMERYDDSVQVYDKLLVLVGDQDPDLLVDFAQILGLQNDGQLAGRPTELLKSALQIDPTNQKGLWLSGFSASAQGELQLAVDYWQRLLTQLPADDDKTRPMLETYITETQQQLGQIPASKPIVAVESSKDSSVKNAEIEVSVSLAPALQDKVKAGDTVFVFARAITGRPMPLAAVKKVVSELPFKIILNDSLAVMPTMKLSSVAEVTVVARISSGGMPTAQTGDLQGQLSPIKVGDRVEIVIDQIVP